MPATAPSTRPAVHPVLARMRARAVAERIPLSGSFELTSRCNLRCVHCYLGAGRVGPAVDEELTAARMCGLIDEAVTAGCLDVLLTGGEPLLRPDFERIYRHARECGTFVTLFTNGTLVSDHHVRLFREMPPTSVEVSTYGATREVYERVTSVPGSFDRCMAGIRRLTDAGVNLTLKTVILRSNLHEVEEMASFARSLGVKFRMDPVLCPAIDGDPGPLAHRVDPRRAASLEFADGRKRKQMRDYLERVGPARPRDRIYTCGAGVMMFYVAANGRLRPCVLTADMAFDARELGFERAWREATQAIGRPRWQSGATCKSCEDLPVCGFCPALLRLERGNAEESSEFLCQLGKARREVIASDFDGVHPFEEGQHAQ